MPDDKKNKNLEPKKAYVDFSCVDQTDQDDIDFLKKLREHMEQQNKNKVDENKE